PFPGSSGHFQPQNGARMALDTGACQTTQAGWSPRKGTLVFVTTTGYDVVMRQVGIADLKAHLSGHLRAVKKGETLLVLDRGTPVARLVPAADSRGGFVTRPPTRDLQSLKQMLKRLRPLDLPVDSLAILVEDRRR
ncbi:MAG TPA: type II toxin-antitoxin system prevent-host-death family antitoxin, partial [Anaeromyxobacteraceae bacterium]|nr:type II toxin-antitoxin system prevent-host-death family antitoxin [Anaeromyxobacteraceae bacterium]